MVEYTLSCRFVNDAGTVESFNRTSEDLNDLTKLKGSKERAFFGWTGSCKIEEVKLEPEIIPRLLDIIPTITDGSVSVDVFFTNPNPEYYMGMSVLDNTDKAILDIPLRSITAIELNTKFDLPDGAAKLWVTTKKGLTGEFLDQNTVELVAPKEVLPGFWERLKDTFKDVLQRFAWILNVGIIKSFNGIHNLVAGTDINEETARSWAEWVPGLNALNKLAFGENLQGEPDTEVTLGEKIELALFMIPIPESWVLKIFSKISTKLGFRKSVQLLDDIVEQEIKLIEKGATKAEVTEIKLLFDQVAGKEFTKAVAKGLTAEELSWVVSTVTKQPLRAIELFVKTPANWEKIGFATQTRVLKALAGTSAPFARETARTLFRTMGGNVGLNAFAAAGKPGIWTGLPSAWKWWLGIVGAIMGTGFITTWAAKEFVWESSTFPLTDAMRKGDWQIAAEQLPRVEKTYEFIKGVINTIGWLNPISNIIFTRGLEEAKANLELWKKQIELHLPPDEPPIEPPTEEPPETPPGEETPDPINIPTTGKSFITIDSNPRGASIWIDGKGTFTVTPFAHLLDSGTHNIQLQLFRYEPTFETVTLEPDKSIIKTYELKVLEPAEPESPFIPVPIDIPLERPTLPEVKPNAWEYTITARDSVTNQILNAKIIIDGIFTGKYTTNSIILEPEATYSLRLEAFGYEPGEVTIDTEALP